jgi:hypothetical protein
VTSSSLTTTLLGYVTNSSLTTTLLSYVTSSSLTTTLLDYVTNSSLTTTLLDYVTSSSLTTTLSSYVTSSSLTTTLTGYASKTVTNTYTALQTFSGGLTSTGLITANGGITATGQPITCGALSCTTETASGLITANGGLTVPANQTLNVTGATVTGIIRYQVFSNNGQTITGYAPNMSCTFTSGSYRIKLAQSPNLPTTWFFNNLTNGTVTITLENGTTTAVATTIGRGTRGTTGILTLAAYTNIVGQQNTEAALYYI